MSNNKLKTRSNWLFFSLFICALGTIFYCYEYYLRVAPSVLRPELKLANNIGEAGFGFLVSLYYFQRAILMKNTAKSLMHKLLFLK